MLCIGDGALVTDKRPSSVTTFAAIIMSDRPILVTGAAGFIGSHLTQRLLAAGRRVVGVDNFCDFYDPADKRRNVGEVQPPGEVTIEEADIRDRCAMLEMFRRHRPDTVVHLAAMAGVRPSIKDPALYTQVNVNGTVHLLDAAAQTDVDKFVFASSSSVYGNNDKVPFAEDDRVGHPISPYAATKRAAELLCHSYAHLSALPVTCLRLFTVFGPRQRPDLAISKFLKLVRDDQPVPMFGDGSTSRDYTYVDDIVTGILAAMRREDDFAIYNLGGNAPITLRDMIGVIEEVVGKPAKIEQRPAQRGDVDRTWADLTKSQANLGYRPATSLADGIARQWAWMNQVVANV